MSRKYFKTIRDFQDCLEEETCSPFRGETVLWIERRRYGNKTFSWLYHRLDDGSLEQVTLEPFAKVTPSKKDIEEALSEYYCREYACPVSTLGKFVA